MSELDMETVKKYFPYILGGGIVIAGIIYYTKSSSSGTSTSLVPSTTGASDATQQAQIAANAQTAQTQIAAQVSGFSGLLSLVNNNNQRASDEQLATINANTNLQIANAQNQTQLASIAASKSMANTQSNNQLIGSLGSAALMFALFCYNRTATARKNRRVYTHGTEGV